MKKQGILTWVLSAAMLCTFTAFGFAGCKDEGAASLPETPIVPQAPAYDGVIVEDGETYALCANAAFLGADVVTTSDSGDVEFSPVAATFTATVEPADAPQDVTWTIEFVNASSSWAMGKVVTDYVTTEVVDETVSTEVRTVCRKPFGEQIKLICTSVQNPSVTAECVLDFVQSPQNVSLTFGDDLPINLGGVTDILWEVNPNGIGVGGDANVDFETYTAYTIADTYTWDIDLTSPSLYKLGVIEEHWQREEFSHVTNVIYDSLEEYDPFFNDGYFCINYTENPDGFIENWNDFYITPANNISSLIFDYNSYRHDHAFGATQIKGSSFWVSTSLDIYKNENLSSLVEEGSMYTLRLTLTGTYHSFTYISLLELEGFTNNPIAQSITLSANDYKF